MTDQKKQQEYAPFYSRSPAYLASKGQNYWFDESDFSSPSLLDNAKTDTILDTYHGYDDGYFRPQQTITRAESSKILAGFINGTKTEEEVASVAAQNQTTADSLFPDVDKAIWYSPYSNFLKKLSIFQGDADGNFSPDKPLNQAEAVTITARLIRSLDGGTIKIVEPVDRKHNTSITMNLNELKSWAAG